MSELNNAPVAVIGGGVMGEVVIRAALASRGPADVRVVERRADRAQQLRDELGVLVTESLGEAVRGARAVVIAVKPQDIPALLEDLSGHLAVTESVSSAGGAADGATPDARPAVTVISVAVGLPASLYEDALPAGTPVVRVMPNTPAVVGAGVAAISPGRNAGEADLRLTEEILAPTGLVVRVPEKQQDAVGAISGSGPAYAFYVIDALAEAGVMHGLPRDLAQRLAVHTIAGAGLMARETGEHPVVLRERVSSPGGTTVAALAELDAGGVRAAFLAAATAAVTRSRQIAEG